MGQIRRDPAPEVEQKPSEAPKQGEASDLLASALTATIGKPNSRQRKLKP